MPLRPLIAVLLAAAVLATGCTSADAPDDGAGTAAADPSGVPSQAVESTPAASPGLRACDLLAPADYKRFVRPALRATAAEGHHLDGDLGSVNTCTVSSGPFVVFRFGYSTDPDAWATIERRTRPQKRMRGGDVYSKSWDLLRRERDEIPNLADEALFVHGFGENTLYALQDGVAYQMEMSGLAGRKGVTLGDYLAVMITLLDHASEGVDLSPVQLPAQCPAPDSREVTAVVGEVARAFGSAYRGTAANCSYVGADGRIVRAGATLFLTDALFDREALRPERMDGVTMLDSPRGVSSGVRREGAHWAYYSALPARVETVVASTGRRSWGPKPTTTVGRAAFLSFVDAYRALATEQLGVKY